MKRVRTRLLKPTPPGGFLDDPPQECPNKVVYQPSPNYEAILIVDYCRCTAAHCSWPHTCQRRLEADRGRGRRIHLMRNGGGDTNES